MRRERTKNIALAIIIIIYTVFIAYQQTETISADDELPPFWVESKGDVFVPEFEQNYKSIKQNIKIHHEKEEKLRLEREEQERIARLQEIENASYMEVCDTLSTFKSMMDYRTITNTTSKQYKLIYSNIERVSFNEYGQMLIGDDLAVAMGDMYGDIGDRFQITLSSGNSYTVIKSDSKGNRCTHNDNSMIEHLVSTELVPSYYLQMGNFNYAPKYNGTIKSIKRL